MKPVADWLGDADRIAELGRRLRDASIPADRLALFRRTLHPEILGRATAWAPGRPVEIFDCGHGIDLSVRFAGSPLDEAMADGKPRHVAGQDIDRSAWRWAEPFRGLGLAALLLRPLSAMSALAIATRRVNGFGDKDLVLLDRLIGDLDGVRRRKKPSPQ